MRGDLSSHFYYRPSAPVKPTKRGGKKPIVCFLPLSDVHLRADPWNPGVEVGRASLSGVSTFSLAFHVFERRGSRPRSKRKVRSEAQERHLLHRSLRNSHDLPDPDSKASARTRLDGQREQLEHKFRANCSRALPMVIELNGCSNGLSNPLDCAPGCSNKWSQENRTTLFPFDPSGESSKPKRLNANLNPNQNPNANPIPIPIPIPNPSGALFWRFPLEWANKMASTQRATSNFVQTRRLPRPEESFISK